MFLYFVPGATAGDKARAALASAPHALEGTPNFWGPQRGPGGKSGQFVAQRGPLPYNEAAQVWEEVPGGAYWIGFDRANPPGPEDLARVPQLNGHLVTLGDGRKWLIPVARKYIVEQGVAGWVVALPRTRRLSAEGIWEEKDVVARHRPLWDDVERVINIEERYATGDPEAATGISMQSETDLVIRAIATNYRISAREASLLGLVDTDVIVPVVQALMDAPGHEEILRQKKAAEAISSPSAVPPGVESTSPGVAG